MDGKYVSHYRVIAKIGEGGMGVVYKARDTHLDRFVALKLLPPEKIADENRKRRFVQEAKAASALSHPNIVHIYDISSAEGLDFIAMEFVAGEALDRIIGRKRLGLHTALGYAVQIADGLSKAHAAGIVHRDLKPANVMVNQDGVIKILDFGLAKLLEPVAGNSCLSEAPTQQQSRIYTEEGAILGTAAYMSPEQAQGKAVDARSDIFSFGAMLYEMLTGERAFQAKSTVQTLAAILEKEPRPVHEVFKDVPPEVERILALCLRKDPQRRWQSMSDVQSLLEDVKKDSESGKLPVEAIPRSAGRRWALPVSVAAALLIAAGSLIAWLILGRAPRRELTAARLTFDSGITFQPTIARDGKLMAYASDRSGEGREDIWVRHLDRLEPIRRTRDPAGAIQPALSPDGSRIVFVSVRENGGLYMMDTLGGEERRISDDGRFPRFSPDGKWIAYTRLGATGMPIHNKMFIIPAQGGEARPFQPEYGAVIGRSGQGPIWSPDSRHILFSGVRSGTSAIEWFVAPAAGGNAVAIDISKALPDFPSPPFPVAWFSPGSLLTSIGATIEGLNLYRIPFSISTFQSTGKAEQLTSGQGLKFYVSTSAEGTILFDNLDWNTYLSSLSIDPATGRASGDPMAITTDTATKLGASASRDGTKLAWWSLTGSAAGLRIEIRVRDLASGRESVVHEGRSFLDKYPRLSRDGSLLAFRERASGGIAAMVVPSTGGNPRQVGLNFRIVDFFPGNQEVLTVEGTGRLARQPLAGGASLILAEASGAIMDPLLSDDGKRVVFAQARNDGSAALCIVPVQNRAVPESEWIVVAESRRHWLGEPNWSADGKAIYYCMQELPGTCIFGRALDPVSGNPQGQPFAVFCTSSVRRSLAGLRSPSGFSVARNRLFFIMSEIQGNIWMLKLPPE